MPDGHGVFLGVTLLGYVPGIIYAWWIIYHNREDPRTGRRINRGQNDVDRRTYLAVSQQGHSSSSPSSGTVHSHDPQSQTVVTPRSSQKTRTITTTTTTRTPSNGGPPEIIKTIITTENGEVVDKKVVVVDSKDAAPPAN
ncbi:hypothetical protein FBU30_005971 [Linnemannia zychae]|nr:hypothetical protein FBU30_005971 [Linnemannia zychae]